MRTLIRRFAAPVICACLADCGPEALPPVPPPAAVTATATAVAAPAEPVLESVPAPEKLAAVLRVGSPIREIAGWRNYLPAHTAFGQLVFLGAEPLAELVFGSLGEHVDVTAPLDVVALSGGEVLVASVVLRDLAEAERAARRDFLFTPRSDGTIDVTPRPGAAGAGLVGKEDLACAVLRGGEPLADHLVCALHREHIDVAGPYLARTVARSPAVDGLRLEIPESTFRIGMNALDAMSKDDEDTLSPGEAAGRRTGERLARAFMDDFASAAVQAQASQARVALALDLGFRSRRSPFTVTLLGSRGQGLPPTFWSLPADSDVAMYFPGAPPDAMRAALGKFWTEMGDALPEDEVPRDVWRKVSAKMSELFLTGGPLLVARGPAPPPPPSQASKAPAGRDAAARHRAARLATAGWALFAAPEPVQRWATGLRELVELDGAGRPKVRAGAGRPSTPGKKQRREHSSVAVVKILPSEKLPPGSLHFVEHNAPNKEYIQSSKGEPPLEAAYDRHFFVAGTADHMWLCISENEALARARILEAMGTGAGIGGRPELEPLRSLPPGGAGFVTLRGLVALGEDADTASDLVEGEARRRALATLPHGGLAPIFLSVLSSDDGDDRASLRVGAGLPVAAALDVIRWIQR